MKIPQIILVVLTFNAVDNARTVTTIVSIATGHHGVITNILISC